MGALSGSKSNQPQNAGQGATAAATTPDPILAKLAVGGTTYVGDGRWVQKRVKPEFWGHRAGDLCPLSTVNCYQFIAFCPRCTANRLSDPTPYREGYCSPYYCRCRERERFQYALR